MNEQVIYTILAIFATIAMALGYALSHIRSRNQIDDLKRKYSELNAKLDKERADTSEKLTNMEKMRNGLQQTFSSLTSAEEEAVEQSISSQGDQVRALMRPLQQALQETDDTVQRLTREGRKTEQLLNQNIAYLLTPEALRRTEAPSVSQTFGTETPSPQWGSAKLKALLQQTRMVAHCQSCQPLPEGESLADEDLPPPAILALANGELLVIDPNLPLEPYLNLLKAPDETVRTWHLESHARKLREKVMEMGSGVYQSRFAKTPCLTILLAANDHYIRSALESDPDLLEDGAREKVVLATPAEILLLLQNASLLWRERAFIKESNQIRQTGLNMYKRFGVFVQLLSQLGSELSGVLQSYNKAVTFFETNGETDEKENPPAQAPSPAATEPTGQPEREKKSA